MESWNETQFLATLDTLMSEPSPSSSSYIPPPAPVATRHQRRRPADGEPKQSCSRKLDLGSSDSKDTGASYTPPQPSSSTSVYNPPSASARQTKRKIPEDFDDDDEKKPACAKQLVYDVPPRKMKVRLGRDWYFSTSEYDGRQFFHLRQFDDGVWTKRGICLNPYQMKFLLDIGENVLDAAKKILIGMADKETEWHLGYGVKLVVKRKNLNYFVDIRLQWQPEDADEPKFTRKGSHLRMTEYHKLLELFPKIRELFPELMDIQRCDCMFQPNQLAYATCRICNPFSTY